LVVDASALVEILLRTPADQAARSQVEGQSIVIPDLAYPETVAVLGRLSRSEAITPTQAELALVLLGRREPALQKEAREHLVFLLDEDLGANPKAWRKAVDTAKQKWNN
jgi:predicted nucleic acid-binding protein